MSLAMQNHRTLYKAGCVLKLEGGRFKTDNMGINPNIKQNMGKPKNETVYSQPAFLIHVTSFWASPGMLFPPSKLKLCIQFKTNFLRGSSRG